MWQQCWVSPPIRTGRWGHSRQPYWLTYGQAHQPSRQKQFSRLTLKSRRTSIDCVPTANCPNSPARSCLLTLTWHSENSWIFQKCPIFSCRTAAAAGWFLAALPSGTRDSNGTIPENSAWWNRSWLMGDDGRWTSQVGNRAPRHASCGEHQRYSKMLLAGLTCPEPLMELWNNVKQCETSTNTDDFRRGSWGKSWDTGRTGWVTSESKPPWKAQDTAAQSGSQPSQQQFVAAKARESNSVLVCSPELYFSFFSWDFRRLTTPQPVVSWIPPRPKLKWASPAS